MLKAREPYKIAVRVGERLSPLDSPGDFEDWEVYWLAGLTALRSIWHCLWNQDRKQSDLLGAIIRDFDKVPWGANSPILKDFVRASRDATLKEWAWDVSVETVTYRRLLELDSYLGSANMLLWRGDEDALRLYEIALVDWHQSLCIIEQAHKEGIREPFSEGGFNKGLLERSDFVEKLPITPRL